MKLLYILILIIGLVNSQLCPIDPTYRPTPANYGPPIISPPLPSTQPSSDIFFDAKDLGYLAKWGSSETSITDIISNLPSEFSVVFPPWQPDHFYLASKQSAPSLKANVNYQFSFEFKLGQPLGDFNDFDNMTLSFYKQGDTDYFFWSNLAVPLYEKTFTGDWSSNTEFKTTTITFSLPFDLGLSTFALQINRTRPTAYDATNFFIRNMKITVLSKPLVPPTNLLTSDSELINIPKPPVALDAQDQTTCPYLATDLVHWHDPNTWTSGVVPLPSDIEIVVPAGKRVLISPCSISQTLVYQKIVVPPTSTLVFADSDFTMNVKDIYVQGKLIMGTETCRYNANINIIFHGAKSTENTIAPFFGTKGIAVSSTGFISVQGKQYHNTWTRLANTVWSGDRMIYLQDSVNWEVGQSVLITTSAYKDELDNQNEVMTIKSIQGKIIEFTEPIKFYHYGGKEYQAEVALLSRRIKFIGEKVSSDADSFGGHVLVNGEGRFAGIQLIRMGQKNVKARYPLHYHLANVVKNSFIKDCSVTQSYYRCYTIHGTNNVTLSRNVAFDVYGHCYYLEDGVEMDNTLSYNLAAYVHTIGEPASGDAQAGETFYENPELTQPADSAAGGFYITNAWNSIIGNAASGGWTGISFPNLDKPIGNHQNVVMEPKAFTTKVFEGNTVHSSGYQFISGASIYVGGRLDVDPETGKLVYNTGRHDRSTCVNGIFSYDPSTYLWMTFNNTKVYLSNLGVSHWGNRVAVIGLEAYDSNRPGSLFGSAWLSTAIVDGQSGNVLSRHPERNRQGFQFYDTYVQTILSHVIFRNFIRDPLSLYPDFDNVALIALTFSDIYKCQFISATINISYVNVAPSQYIGHRNEDSGSSRYFNYIDFDGSSVGKNVPTIIGSHDNWWQYSSSACTFNNDWKIWVCDKGSKTVGNIEIYVPNLIVRGENDYNYEHVGHVGLFGDGITDIRKTTITKNAGITGVLSTGWYFNLDKGSPTHLQIWVAQVPFGQYIFLAIPYPAGTTFEIYTENKWSWNNWGGFVATMTTSAAAVRSSDGTKYYFDGSFLYVKIVNPIRTGQQDEFFSRAGVSISEVYWEYNYYINATNENVTPSIDGFYAPQPFTLPSPNL